MKGLIGTATKLFATPEKTKVTSDDEDAAYDAASTGIATDDSEDSADIA